ncbi:hypothetical protein, partial [Nocardia cerradoensis]|uniref:hypothetical protein n=1 Tax=Nocardia cerradoensis TaxID=85688 RepID=UPI001CB9A064
AEGSHNTGSASIASEAREIAIMQRFLLDTLSRTGNRSDPGDHTDPATLPTPWSRPGAERPQDRRAEPDSDPIDEYP